MKEGPREIEAGLWRACASLRIGVARRGGPLWGKGSGVSCSEKAVVCPWARRMALYLKGEIHVVRHDLSPRRQLK
jgi:hypothetical protein